MVKRIVEPPKPYVYRYEPYPRWILGTDGNRKIVQNHEHEERERGVKMNPDGTVFVDPELEQFQLGAEAAALGTTPEDLKDLRQMASAGEPLVKPRGKKSAAPVQSGELAKDGGW